MNTKNIPLIFDLDGVVIRMTGTHYLNTDHYIEMRGILEKWKKIHGESISVVTDRSAGQLQPLVYYLGLTSGYWATEKGAVIYNVKKNNILIPDGWKNYASTYVPALKAYLTKKLSIPKTPQFDAFQFNPAPSFVRTSIIPPHNKASLAAQADKTLLAAFRYKDKFLLSRGRYVEFDPIDLSKKDGIEAIYQYNHLKNSPAVFIADSHKDMPAAKEVVKRGGTVCAVGNAEDRFKKYVKQARGIVAPPSTSYHQSVSYILRKLMGKNE